MNIPELSDGETYTLAVSSFLSVNIRRANEKLYTTWMSFPGQDHDSYIASVRFHSSVTIAEKRLKELIKFITSQSVG